jgi:hypothetical protein
MKKVMLIVLSLFFIFSLVSAAPPVTTVQQFSTGYVIESSPTEYIKQNTDYVINFFVYNISNGVRAGSSLTCYAYLADSQGNLKAYNNVPWDVRGYWMYNIKAGNFTETGHYPYGIACNSSNLGGASVEYFEVNVEGAEFTLTKMFIYGLSLIFMVMMILALLFIINRLPESNSIDEKGNIMQINWLKYFRPLLWIVIYGISLGIIFILSNIALSNLVSPMLGNILFAFYRIAFWFMICALPVYSIWILVRAFQDREMKKLIERGVDIKSTP